MTLIKWILPSLAIVSLVAGCQEHSDAVVEKDKAAAHSLNSPANAITGTWSGMFEPVANSYVFDKATGDSLPATSNKITLFIDQMENGQIFGYSICAGSDRPFTGIYTEDGDKITAKLREPGSGKFDGIFNLVITKSPLSLSGKWVPLTPGQVNREYTLTRKNFAYNPSAGRYADASTKLLTSDDVNNLYKEDLRYMRNEIYARHGYSFKLKEVRAWFDNEDWYMPVSTDVRKKLTSIELKNEKLIKQFEKYAEDNYDDFGR
jgi:hypothetical protein